MPLTIRSLTVASMLLALTSSPSLAEPVRTQNAAPKGCEWRRELPAHEELFCKTSDGLWTKIGTPPGFDEYTVEKAKSGNGQAMALLGLYYSSAPTDINDYEASFYWYIKSAISGNTAAKNYLDAYDLLNGPEASENGPAALEKNLAAANAGLPAAMFAICQMYASGHGAPRDNAEAFRWCHKAADGGVTMAMLYLLLSYTNGGGGAEADPIEANRWARAAADRGDIIGITALANQYLKGMGVPQDSTEAAHLYRLAAGRGSSPAMYLLSNMYLAGDGVPKDKTEALRWMRAAAAKGNQLAQKALQALEAAPP